MESAALAALALLLMAAAPATAADSCPNAEIRAQQGPEVEALPDCMAIEMVSPPNKFLQGAVNPSVSANGERVVLRTRGAIGDPPGQFELFYGDPYVVTRGPAGWRQIDTMVPPPRNGESLLRGWDQSRDKGRSLSPDFSQWVTHAGTLKQTAIGVSQLFRGGLRSQLFPLSPLLVPVVGNIGGITSGGDDLGRAKFQGASADHSRLFFQPGEPSTAYSFEDPSPAGTSSEPHLYVAGLDHHGAPSVQLAARDGNGKVWGGRCGARLGGLTAAGLNQFVRDQGAISQDGAVAFFTTRPDQAQGVDCAGTTNKLRIMRRVETSAGAWISELFSSECIREAPTCSTVDGDDLFQGASVDQSRVFFTTTRQLTDTDRDIGAISCSPFFGAPGCDLYLYDKSRPNGKRLVQISAGDETNPSPGSGANVYDGVAAISGDGSHVYFVATGVLTTKPSPDGATAIAGQPNLYVYREDTNTADGDIAFIGTASAADAGLLWAAPRTQLGDAYPVPVVGRDGLTGEEVGGSGHILAFRSRAAFTDDDHDGGRVDVFLYDSRNHEITRISKGEPGGADNQPEDVLISLDARTGFAGTAFAEYGRWVSEDGSSITFKTTERLTPDDTNDKWDDYLWRDGKLYLLPGTSMTDHGLSLAGSVGGPVTPSLSHDGSSVAFTSFSQILPADGDTVADVYLAREGGGFKPDPEPSPCEPLTGACQSAASATTDTDQSTDSVGESENMSMRARRVIVLPRPSARVRKFAARRGVLPLRIRTGGDEKVMITASTQLSNRRLRLVKRLIHTPAGQTIRFRVRLKRAVLRHLNAGRTVKITVRAAVAGDRFRFTTFRLRGIRR